MPFAKLLCVRGDQNGAQGRSLHFAHGANAGGIPVLDHVVTECCARKSHSSSNDPKVLERRPGASQCSVEPARKSDFFHGYVYKFLVSPCPQVCAKDTKTFPAKVRLVGVEVQKDAESMECSGFSSAVLCADIFGKM